LTKRKEILEAAMNLFNGNYFISNPDKYNEKMIEKSFQIYCNGISNDK